MTSTRVRFAAGIGCVTLLTACAPESAGVGSRSIESLAITGVTVIDVATGTALPDRTVLVADDRIVEVGPTTEVSVPPGATLVPSEGKYLIPGLWDMHVHTSTDDITREALFPLFIAHGVTGVRSMAADCFEDETPSCEEEPLATILQVEAWETEIAEGSLVGPRVVAGSYYVNGPSPDEPSTPYNPGTPEDARAHVRILADRGVDFIKIYSGLDRDAFFALAEEARRIGLPFEGHVPEAVRASEASEAGMRSIEHLGDGNVLVECSTQEGQLRERFLAEIDSEAPYFAPIILQLVETYDPGRCANVAATLVRHGTWVVPTLMVMRLPEELEPHWRDDPLFDALPETEVDLWTEYEGWYTAELGDPETLAPHARWARELLRSMVELGVPVMAGSDAGDPGVFWGRGLHEELELMVDAGLTAATVLRSATLAPAEFLGATDSLGTIQPGKIADLVLVDGDPLVDIANTQRIQAVIVRGRLLERSDLDGLLDCVSRESCR